MRGEFLKHLPLRARLVAGFSAATVVALVAAGIFVYWRVEYALDRGLDTELSQASAALTPLIASSGRIDNRAAADATAVGWQVIDARGRVIDHGGPVGSAGLIGPGRLAQLAQRSKGANLGDFDLLPAESTYRLRVTRESTETFLVVAVRRDHRDEALRELLLQLAVAGVAMLAFSSFVGERLARAALRPVERYRSQAAAITEGATDLRLDVPERRNDEVTRLGHTFNEMLDSLERALDRERRFVNEASHELRTPITLLASRIQLARRRKRTAAEYEAVLADLDIDVRRLAELAEHLLQVGSAGEQSSGAAGDLAGIARRVSAGWMDSSPELRVDLPAGAVPVALSDVQSERILTNLLANASTHGAPPITLRVDEPGDGWARLQVSDAGTEMTPELLRSATGRFTRSDDARSRPGAGLGLSLVTELTSQAGGELRLCFDGHHVSYGRAVPVACDHDRAMVVTVLLPEPASAPDVPA